MDARGWPERAVNTPLSDTAPLDSAQDVGGPGNG